MFISASKHKNIKSPRLLYSCVLIALALWGNHAAAQTQPLNALSPKTATTKNTSGTIRQIEIVGAERLQTDTILGYVPVQTGDAFNEQISTATIKNLFATGFFSDVNVAFEHGILKINIQERPVIDQIEFGGVKEFDNEQLKSIFKENGIGTAQIYDPSVLERAIQALKLQYLGRGKYGTQVIVTTTPLDRGRVSIYVAVNEGEIAKIRGIRFFGNERYSESDLLDLMTLRTPGFWTWYTKSDRYSKQTLSADLQAIRNFYLSQGFLEFAIRSTQVSLTPDKQEMYLTIEIDEGLQYKVSSVKLVGTGTVVGTISGGWKAIEQELQPQLTLKPGEVFDGEKLNQSLRLIQDKLGEKGYAFAIVNPIPNLNKEKEEVDFTIAINLGRRMYVRRIEIAGNTRTRDEAIRREVNLFEGGVFNGKTMNDSRDKIDRLGFFSDVAVETKPVVGSEDQIDLLFTVQERLTNTFNAGLSYSSLQKLGLSLGIDSKNVFGSGQDISLAVDTTKANRTIDISTFNPYFTDDGVSQRLSIYQRRLDSSQLTNNYLIRTDYGVAARYGFPLTDSTRLFVGTSLERTELQVDQTKSSSRYLNYVNLYGDTANSLFLTLGWAKDTRDNVLTPSRGQYFSINTDRAVAGDLRYSRAATNYQFYLPAWSHTLAFNLDLAAGKAHGDHEYPFFRNYYVGGQGSVRGYEYGSLGPRDTNDEDLGGNKKMNFNLEWLMPLPGMNKDKSLRFVVFLDGGYAWAEHQQPRLGDLRYSKGFGLSWISPIGPLKFSWGYPINSQPTDKVSRFEFKIGTAF